MKTQQNMRNLVDIVDGKRSQLCESVETFDVRKEIIAEANRLRLAVESQQLSEQELNEIWGGLSALGRAAGGAVKAAGTAVANKAADTYNKAATSVANTYKAGETRAAAQKALGYLNALDAAVQKLGINAANVPLAKLKQSLTATSTGQG